MCLAAVLVGFLDASPALAHWCTNIWDTPSRIVVKPERETVFVSDTIGDTETLVVTVRNNFPYTLDGVRLAGDNDDFEVTSSPANAQVQPDEDQRFTLTLRRLANSGDDNLYLKITLGTTHMGSGTHDIESDYWTKALPSESEIAGSNGQATHLMWQKFAELEGAYPSRDGLDEMLARYGHHRLQYTSSGGGYNGTSWYVSQHPMDRSGFDFWMWDHAQAQRGLMDLAMLHLSDSRIQDAFVTCMDDPMPLWRGMCAVLAAGFTPGPAVQARIEVMAGADTCDNTVCSNFSSDWSPSDDARALAKAALIILGQSQHQSEVEAYCYGDNDWESYVCAAALGIAGQDDPVIDILLPDARDSSGNLVYLFASYLLNLTASHRRGPTGEGCVSFYGESCVTDDVPPMAPQNLQVAGL